MSTSSMKVVIFGATGAIGTSLAEALSKEHSDWNIQAVTRSSSSKASRLSLLPNVEMVQGDPLDRASVLSLTKDCDIIFSCIGFHKYELKYWAKHWPLVLENMLGAVTQPKGDPIKSNQTTTTRKLVFCDNLYAYGAGHTEPISPKTPTVEANLQSKPSVRSLLRERFLQHMKEHPGTLTVVGGADFFAPHVTDKSILGDTITGKIVQNQTALALGNVNVVHDFCFAPDFGRALATVVANPANMQRAEDHFWICPHSIHNKSVQEIANDIATKVGQRRAERDAKATQPKTPVPISALNKFLLYLFSPFMSFAYEMIEMYSFWSEPYHVDDSDFLQTFGVQATPYDEALQALVDFYLEKEQEQ